MSAADAGDNGDEHLDEDAVSAFLLRQLDGEERARADRHLHACAACRALVEGYADAFAETASEPESLSAPLAGASRIGDRWVVLRTLGAGGAGVVLAAYDPVLDRKVALKMLRATTRNDESRRSLVREAQAMARLSHPNVTAVYDVAEIDDEIAIAMEFVDGENAREWLARERHDWRKIVEVFVDAGRGLAAAHKAGIVHRDFKPANVLLGKDGRVSVTDFGLATSTSARPGEAPGGEGGLAGTPAYMSPEQLDGNAAGPASDQFAFGVSLYEALCDGEHPFRDPKAPQPASTFAAVRAGRRRPLSPRAPRWVVRAVSRALERDPALRHPSMEALLDALSLRRRRRRTRAAGASVTALLFVGLLAYTGNQEAARQAALCAGAPIEVSEVFGADARARVQRAFSQSALPFADDTHHEVERALDAHLARWSDLFTDTCKATRVRGEQPEAVFTARMLCLARAKAEMRALVDRLAEADDALVVDAVRATSALSDLQECRAAEQLLGQQQPSPESRDEVERARVALAEARVYQSTGERARAATMRDDVLGRARRLSFAPLLAEAFLARGRAEAMSGEQDKARADLRAAIIEANRGRHDRAAGEAWIDLVVLSDRDDVGLAVSDAALAALARIGHDDTLEARLAGVTGLVLASSGRYAEALVEQRKALAIAERLHDDAQVAIVQSHVAEILVELGDDADVDEARAFAERSRTGVARAFGPTHPMVAMPLSLLAEAARRQGDAAACVELARAALAVRAAVTSSVANAPVTLVPRHLLLARCLSAQGESAQARAELARANDVVTARALSADDPWRGRVLVAEAELLVDEGRARAAVDVARAAQAQLVHALGPTHPDVVVVARETLARALAAAGRADEARAETSAAAAARVRIRGRP